MSIVGKLLQIKALLKVKPTEVTAVKKVNKQFVQDLISGLGVDSMILDGKYYMANESNMLNVIAWDWTEKKKFILDRYDCDDFAFTFKANVNRYYDLNQVGVVVDWSSRHAYNIILFPNRNIWLFEPQTDSFFFVSERKKFLYSLEDAVIII